MPYWRTLVNMCAPKDNAITPFEAGMAAALPQQAVMGAYIAVSALELFIQKQVVTFDGSALPALSGGFTFVPRQGVRFSTPVLSRFLQQQQQPPRKHQRTSQHVSAVGSNVALVALARPLTLRPAHAVRVLCNTNKPCRSPPSDLHLRV